MSQNYIIPKKDSPLHKLAVYNGLSGANTSVQILNAFKYKGNSALQLGYEKDSPVGTSILGTPVYTNLTIQGVEYTDNLTGRVVELLNDRFGANDQRLITAGQVNGLGAGFYMQFDTVLITVQQSIRIVKTEIQGRNGTVKEYIGADDSKVAINLIITGKNGVYPREEVNRLKAWLDAPVTKTIVAWWLGNLGVDNIVIEDYEMPQVRGGYSYQIVNINAISDAPVQLKITQPIQ